MSAFPKTLRTTVTRELIRQSKAGNSSHCVMATTLRHMFPAARNVIVDADSARMTVGDYRATYDLDAAALRAIARNDAKKAIRPFVARLKLRGVKLKNAASRDAASYEAQKAQWRADKRRRKMRKPEELVCYERRRVNGYDQMVRKEAA